MACARVMRGTSSTEKSVTPVSMAGSSAEGSSSGRKKADYDAAGLDLALVLGRGRVHHGQDVGGGEKRGAVGGQRGPGLRVGFVGDARRHARAGFHRNLKAIGDQLLDGIGKQRNTGLSNGCFLHNDKTQDISSKPDRLARFTRPSRAGYMMICTTPA